MFTTSLPFGWWCRRSGPAAREGRQIAGVIQRHDHGSRYASVAYSERLAAEEVRPSMDVVSSSDANALAETINGL